MIFLILPNISGNGLTLQKIFSKKYHSKKKSASTVTAVGHIYFGLFVGFVGLFIVKVGS